MPNNIALINNLLPASINGRSFDDIALSVFNYQYNNNNIYRQYCDAIGRQPQSVTNVLNIPFLPISFFKTHKVVASGTDWPLVFESSGTTGETPSRHFVADAAIYRQSLLQGFESFYGGPQQYVFLALLPSYLERKNASLVHMAQTLMEVSAKPENGFYINEWEKLAETITQLEWKNTKTILLGVTFALLDFAEAHPLHMKNTIVMETGGMKGRREEWTRAQVHTYLKDRWNLQNIHSEYGMTELLSQAYATTDGIFNPTNTMRVLVRDINDPLETSATGSGCLNIIDLANIYSCSFVATEDIGRVHDDGSFEVLGRLDHAALRGCSLMVV